ncbi:MAG: hypothetical protein PUB22_07230 [Clostridiales bacterium]|nr:hypothetical protein [Clostridiales bacterium]
MMRQFKKVFLGMCLVLILAGCGAKQSPETSAAEENTQNSVEVETASVPVEEEETQEQAEGDMSTADTQEETAEEESAEGQSEELSDHEGYTEEDPDILMELLDECADVAPGTAGSSLRGAKAAGQLLDWGEEVFDMVTEDSLAVLVQSWVDESSENEVSNFREAWQSVYTMMQDIADDPEGSADLLEGAGYQLSYDKYHQDFPEMMNSAVEKTLK